MTDERAQVSEVTTPVSPGNYNRVVQQFLASEKSPSSLERKQSFANNQVIIVELDMDNLNENILDQLFSHLKGFLEIRPHFSKKIKKKLPNCFQGSKGVTALRLMVERFLLHSVQNSSQGKLYPVKNIGCHVTRKQMEQLGAQMQKLNKFDHTKKKREFADKKYYYQVNDREMDWNTKPIPSTEEMLIVPYKDITKSGLSPVSGGITYGDVVLQFSAIPPSKKSSLIHYGSSSNITARNSFGTNPMSLSSTTPTTKSSIPDMIQKSNQKSKFSVSNLLGKLKQNKKKEKGTKTSVTFTDEGSEEEDSANTQSFIFTTRDESDSEDDESSVISNSAAKVRKSTSVQKLHLDYKSLNKSSLTSLDSILNDEKAFGMFRDFCAFDHSSEAIDFWITIRDFKHNITTQQPNTPNICDYVNTIHDTFIKTMGKRPVNINSSVQRDCTKKIQDFTNEYKENPNIPTDSILHVFDKALDNVEKDMLDIFARFVEDVKTKSK